MESYDPPFNWIHFPECRARFAGGVRGLDERGHETFAVDLDGVEYFGEIVSAFLPNDNDYNIEVVSFGFGDEDFAGEALRPGIALVLSEAQVARVARIIRQLIVEGARMDDPPHLLVQYPNARFMGGVLFRDGWVLVDGSAHDSAMPAMSNASPDGNPQPRRTGADGRTRHAG